MLLVTGELRAQATLCTLYHSACGGLNHLQKFGNGAGMKGFQLSGGGRIASGRHDGRPEAVERYMRGAETCMLSCMGA